MSMGESTVQAPAARPFRQVSAIDCSDLATSKDGPYDAFNIFETRLKTMVSL